MRAAFAVVVLVTGLGLILSKEAMGPSSGERLVLYLMCVAATLLAGLACWWLIRIHRRLASLRWTLLLVAVAAVAVAGTVVGLAAAAMLFAPPDVRLVLAALTMGTGLGVLVALGVTGPLTADLRELAVTASRVADGDLAVRTGIDRRDEVGVLARALDRMVGHLALLEDERAKGEAARRQLLAAIGHDLRTPLASLRAAIEAIQDGVAADPDRYLRAMGADVELLRSMVDDLFVLTRLEAGDLRLDWMPFDLSEVVDGAVEATAAVGNRRGVEVRLRGDGTAPVVGDPKALDRVLRNVLDNAIQHAPPTTTVHVTLATAGAAAIVRVRDEGPGFPPEFVVHAFDRFSRADAARERRVGGAGLGLAIARELVEAHGGHIWIEPGAGGRITFRLPVTNGAGPPAETASERRTAPVAQGAQAARRPDRRNVPVHAGRNDQEATDAI